jgi:hypothetical protein
MKKVTKIVISVLVLALLIWFGFWIYENGRIINYYDQENPLQNSTQNSTVENIHVCTLEENQAQACTMQYDPVCGLNYNCGNQTLCEEKNISCGACIPENITYGNGCVACSSGAQSWTRGECS